MRQLEPIISSLPYNGIPGNHEVANSFEHYRMRFSSIAENAGKNSGSQTAMYYSCVIARNNAAPAPPATLTSFTHDTYTE